MARRHSIVAIAVAVLLGLTLVLGSYLAQTPNPASIRFDGVSLNTSYLGGISHVFGPTEQNACNESALSQNLLNFRPSCPTQLVGGTSYAIQFFVSGYAGSSPGLWVNMSVEGVLYFQVNPGTSGALPPGGSYSLTPDADGADQLYVPGEVSSWVLVFTFPNSLPSTVHVPGGLWFYAWLTVQPTDETTIPG